MGSEQEPIDRSDLYSQHVAAIGQFDHELDSLVSPVTREMLLNATRRLIHGLFHYNSTEAKARMNAFEARRDIPEEDEIDNEQESVATMLKLSLFERLPEEYILVHGKEAFDQWIGPYMRSLVNGHTNDTQSYQHLIECTGQARWCPSLIATRMMRGELEYDVVTLEHNEIYIPYANEIIYMNIRIVEELVASGSFTQAEGKRLLAKYQDWVEAMEVEHQIAYDKDLFDRVTTK